MRRAHYWRPSGDTRPPANRIALGTARTLAGRSTDGHYEAERVASVSAVAWRVEHGRDTRLSRVTAAGESGIAEWVLSRLEKRRTTLIVCWDAIETLLASGLWSVVCGGSSSWRCAVVSSDTVVLRGRIAGHPVEIVDISSLAGLSRKEAERAVDGADRWTDGRADDDLAVESVSMADAELVRSTLTAYCDWIQRERLGAWSMTLAGQGASAIRHDRMNGKVLVHCHPDAMRLERSSYYGGRVDVAYVGTVRESPLTELDYMSLYPSLACGPLPCRIAGHSRRLGPDALSRLLDQYAVTAECLIETDAPSYPVRSGGRTVYPVGLFRTVLPDPELREAVRLGHVRELGAACWHHMTDAVAPLFRAGLTARQLAHADGRLFDELLWKRLLNATIGKIGQRTTVWLPWGEESLRRIESAHGMPDGELSAWYDRPPRLGAREETRHYARYGMALRMRDIWGCVEIDCGKNESRDSVASIPAYITSAGRLRLLEAQRTAGKGHWYYSDTDSVWVDDVGLSRLYDAGMVSSGEPGLLRIKRHSRRLIIHAGRDYEHDEGRVLAGVPSDAQVASDGTYTATIGLPARALYEDTGCQHELRRVVSGRIRRIARAYQVRDDGWTTPITLEEEMKR